MTLSVILPFLFHTMNWEDCMKQIEINKQLNLIDCKAILSLTEHENFEYKTIDTGIRCVGPFIIEGEYRTNNGIEHFSEQFEFDIFASNDKLDGNEFKVVYKDYTYTMDHFVYLNLYFDVYGVYEEQIENKVEDEELNGMEELFDEKDTVITSYSFVVVKRNDSYESIAERYNVKVDALKEINQNKAIVEKDLLVLPFLETK